MLICNAPSACVPMINTMQLLLLPPYLQHKFASNFQEHLQGPGLRAQ